MHCQRLVALWMTEDYLNCSGENQDFKETGLDYIRQFCSRSLFQVVEDTKSMIRFTMDDLVHDLAISVAQVEYSTVNCRPSDSFEMVRHVSLTAKDLRGQDKKVPSFMLELNKVRTILFPHEEETCSNHDVVKKCILRFKYMRVLNLSWFNFEEMPTSIGKLSHLRYLSLYKNELIRKLPNSICKLLHLHVLNLAFCKALEELPKDIGNLSNLRTLSLTTKQTYLPKGIGNLSSLSVLAFYACENLKSLGEEIQSLTTLQELWIDSCEELESMPRNMKLLTSLHTLVIISSEKLELVKSGEGTRGLQRFCVWISNLEALPHWLEESAETLQNLEICSFFSLKVLPEWLQGSKMLNRLVIKHSPELLALPEGMHQLTALRQVEIDGCPELSESFKSQLQEDQNWSMFARRTKITLHD